MWLKFRPLAYQHHPYKWATIGKEISHIEDATMDDVKDFFFTHYVPNNAVLVVAGNVETQKVKALAEKWFGPIPAGKKKRRELPAEPVQRESGFLKVEADVPADAFYMGFPMAGRFDADYYAADLMSDVLGRGESSRLYETLVKDKALFTSLSSYVMGTIDPGLLIISGRVKEGVSIEDAEKAVWDVLQQFMRDGVGERELEKVKNQAESTIVFGETEVMNRAMGLAFASLSGDANLINEESALIKKVTAAEIKAMAQQLLQKEKSTVLHYVGK